MCAKRLTFTRFVIISVLAAFFIMSSGAVPSFHARERRGAPMGDFDFYVLALSWSPGFCELEGREKGRDQCFKSQRPRFVVHGLWPQNNNDYPSYCEPRGRSFPFILNELAREIFPDEGLARYQWMKHGACSGLTPRAYLEAVRDARHKLVIPAEFDMLAQEKTTSPLMIERAFSEVNRALRPDMMSVSCRRGVFQELRICLTKDLRDFQACPSVDRQGCKVGHLRIIAP
jgi:ribonuclease T2